MKARGILRPLLAEASGLCEVSGGPLSPGCRGGCHGRKKPDAEDTLAVEGQDTPVRRWQRRPVRSKAPCPGRGRWMSREVAWKRRPPNVNKQPPATPSSTAWPVALTCNGPSNNGSGLRSSPSQVLQPVRNRHEKGESREGRVQSFGSLRVVHTPQSPGSLPPAKIQVRGCRG